jgi:hypothetical protein
MDDSRKYAKLIYTKINLRGGPRLGGKMKVELSSYSP